MNVKKKLLEAKADGTTTSTIFTGRPMRVLKSPYVMSWATERAEEGRKLQAQGIIPTQHDVEQKTKRGEKVSFLDYWPTICGQAAGGISEILPAEDIVKNMVSEAIAILQRNAGLISKL